MILPQTILQIKLSNIEAKILVNAKNWIEQSNLEFLRTQLKQYFVETEIGFALARFLGSFCSENFPNTTSVMLLSSWLQIGYIKKWGFLKWEEMAEEGGTKKF